MFADSYKNLNRQKKCVSQLLNVHIASDVRQIEIHMAEPLVPGPNRLKVEIAVGKLEKYKSPDNVQILAKTDSSRR
jgi:hypothetical protein